MERIAPVALPPSRFRALGLPSPFRANQRQIHAFRAVVSLGRPKAQPFCRWHLGCSGEEGGGAERRDLEPG